MVPDETLQMIQHYEGYRSRPYLCPAGYWTVGWGHVLRDANGKALRKGGLPEEYRRRFSREECVTFLQQDLAIAEEAVQRLVRVPLTPYQLGTLVSFIYNVGILAFMNSTLRHKLNAGDYEAVPTQLQRWVYGKINGKFLKLPGLVARRRAEALHWTGMKRPQVKQGIKGSGNVPLGGQPKGLGTLPPPLCVATIATEQCLNP